MVRNYVKKHPSRSHNQDDLKGAIQDVVENKMAIYSAAKKYGIPRTTLRHHLENKKARPSHHTYLNGRGGDCCNLSDVWRMGIWLNEG